MTTGNPVGAAPDATMNRPAILAASSPKRQSAPDVYREGDAELWRSRVPRRALERLERHIAKIIRAVLRGGGDSNAASLPDPKPHKQFKKEKAARLVGTGTLYENILTLIGYFIIA